MLDGRRTACVEAHCPVRRAARRSSTSRAGLHETPNERTAMDPHVSFMGLLAVAAIAFLTPLLLAASPARRIPPVVLLVLAGIVIGPSGLGLVTVDEPIRILSLLGITFLLFLAGLEVD